MQTATPRWQQLVLPIGFTLLCVVLTIGVWRSFGGTVPMEGEGYRVDVSVPQAESLFANTPVLAAGVQIGRIVAVRPQRGRGELSLEIDPEFAPIRSGASVIARTKTLLGEGYLELTPGDVDATPVRDGGRLAASRVRTTQRLDDVLETFDPAARAQFRRLFAGTERAFSGRAAAMNRTLGRARPVSADLRTVVDTLHQQRPELRSLVRDAGTVLATLGARDATLESAIGETRRVLAVTAERDTDLRETIAALPGFLGDLRAASEHLDAAVPDLRTAVASLRPTAPLVEPAFRAVLRDTPVFRRVFAQLPGLVRSGERALPALERTLQSAGPAMEPLHLAVRQLLPALRLAAASRRDMIGAIANSAGIANGRLAGQNGQINGYATGWLTVWNEILSGWTKKLPTNRPNPYFAPGGSAKIATGGLEAFDCRHVNNPLVVPALGTGSPPCVTQQPWALNGRTTAYPRLLLDPP